MAQSERDRAQYREEIDLSDDDVDGMWKEIVTNCRRPKLARATSAWDSLGENYRALGTRSCT